jgi:hypothetical protein
MPISRRGDLVAAAGFVSVLALSVFPWSHGLVSGLLSAWTVHWSLVTVALAACGLVVSMIAWRRSRHPLGEGLAEAVLAVCVGAGAILHIQFPPSLSEATAAPFVAVGASAIALSGALLKVVAARRATAGPRSP